MKILYVTSEAAPFAASGGLGDVLGALPIACEREGADCSVILPLYGTVKECYRKEMTRVIDMTFDYAWRKTGASVFSLEKGGVTYYFVENGYYFNRGKLYGEYDDGERFAFFSLAVMEFLRQTGNYPDVLHANDWQSAMTVVYTKTKYSIYEEFRRIKTVFTIHNIEYQGKFDPYVLGDIFALDVMDKHILEYNGALNLLKGAVTVSDLVSTVSPNYARELRQDFFSFGLSGVMLEAVPKMRGIINGIDTEVFSPDTGADIVKPYTLRNMKTGKRDNKLALQKELGLPVDKEIPLVVMITRLTEGKGVDLVLCVLRELLAEGVQFVLLGTGDKRYEDAFSAIASEYPDAMRALITFDRALSKRMYASADLFLMPSKSEPCGLSQMIACSYGTVPVVRAVGGLYDSIVPYGKEGANGFTFGSFNAHDMLFTLKYAISLYKNEKETFDALAKSAKKTDFTWAKSAKEYMKMYGSLMG